MILIMTKIKEIATAFKKTRQQIYITIEFKTSAYTEKSFNRAYAYSNRIKFCLLSEFKFEVA